MSFFLGDLARDLRYGARTLAADRRFTIVALLTLVLTVASVTTVFALVYSVLLRPLPYPDDDRLMFVESVQPKGFGTAVSFGDATAFREQARSFDSWGLYRRGYLDTVVDAQSQPRYVHDMLVTPELFPMLGIDVALGRTLLPSDAEASAANAVVISHEVWQTVFGGDAGVLGRTLPMREGTFAVVGVTPPGANVPGNWLDYPVVWRPVRAATANPDFDRFAVLARLRADVSIEAGRAELGALAAGLAAAQPDTHEGRVATVTPLRDEIVGNFKRLLWIFFGAVACVWLIGVGNLTILQLARNAAREREVAVRAALGAGRARLVHERVVESVLLCSVGGALGLVVAWLVVRLVVTALPTAFPRVSEIGVSAAVAVFAFGVSMVVGAVVGGLPAWHASAPRLTAWLNESGRTATVGSGRSRAQRVLVAAQTAVALVLLIGAGLLANSFYHLLARDAGMQEQGLWVARGALPLRYNAEPAQQAFWASALEQVRAIAGVQSAALSVNDQGPLAGGDTSTGIVQEGAPPPQNLRDGVSVSYRRVSDEYFETLGLPMAKGRPILASDAAGAESVVVVNELAATQLWVGEDPLGKRLNAFGELRTVVGVIPTFRHTRLDGNLKSQIYLPSFQDPNVARGAAILFRTEPGDRRPSAAVRATLIALEKDLEDLTVTTMADVRWRLVQPERFRTGVLLAFAGSAVLLALVGIIGVVAYTVGQRHREIAVRVALGAVPRHILRLTSRQAIVPAFWGLALGLGGAVVATRLLSSYLVDVRALDVPTFAAAVVALALFVAAAAVMTARRALVVDPVEALRAE